MIGVGTQDSLEQAQEFATDAGISTQTLVWDSSGESWLELGVTRQPAWMTFDTDGNVTEVRYNPVDFEALAGELAS